ncbi:rhodanese-like domain-containing protein [Pseudonocardia tropica]|uniref:Rhodanese-like domain-containing protein n=1 Tax=Pseudonocardia tropica TaxID=681289 RepID=A0ABV1JSD3_9PSEU
MNSSERVAFFAAKLHCETDPADVRAGTDGAVVLVDVRSDAAWAQGRLPGARHLPGPTVAARVAEIPVGTPVVVYCWGPGCNGATRAALALARHGHEVREMIGGFEYWAREGYPVETDTATTAAAPDPLTAPCGC